VITLANAPVSYGVFELTAGDAELPPAGALLDAVADAGYPGVDLGPVGYFGDAKGTVERLAERGLALAGGWVQLRLVDPDGFAQDLPALEEALDIFSAARDAFPDRAPKPTLADAGSPARQANPGRGKDLPELRLDPDGWRVLGRNLAEVAGRCRDRGLEPTFHHHACTYVEAPQEVEAFLDVSDVDLCLDTGHLLVGGGEPVEALRRWCERVNHVHLKDVRLDVLRGIIDEAAGMHAVWERGTFCELGTGDLDVDGFLDGLRAQEFSGWLIVEQDRIAAPGEPLGVAAAAQARNLEFLRARGF
jgi:inosose dehydratase